MNIQEFRDRVENWNSDLTDTKALSPNFKLDDWILQFTGIGEDSALKELFGASLVDEGQYRVHMLEQARTQLAGRLAIPSRWIQDPEKCPRELREQVFNWKFLNAEQKDFFLRLRSGNLRAVLTEQYTPFDHADLFGAVYNALEQEDMLPHVEVLKQSLGDTMSAYIVWKGTDFNGNGNGRPMGDGGGTGGLKPAVYVSNSEIGTGASRIHGGLYRSFCVNGMILGWEAKNTFQIIHRHKNRKTISLLANEAIAVALKLSEKAAVKFIESQNQFIAPSSLKSIIGKWSRKYGLTVGQNESWLETLTTQVDSTGQVSYADIINEATYAANRTEDSELAQTFERMAGEMVFAELPREVVLANQLT